MSKSFSAGPLFRPNPITEASSAQNVLDTQQCLCWCSAKGDWGGLGDASSCLSFSALYSTASRTCRENPTQAQQQQQHLPACSRFTSRYSSTEVPGGPHYLPCCLLFPAHLLKKARAQPQPVASVFSGAALPLASHCPHPRAGKAFPFHQGIASSRCVGSGGTTQSAAAK